MTTTWHYRQEYRNLHVVGISMGGSMALKLAELYSGTPNAMSSIATIAAPVVYNSLLRDRVVLHPTGYIGRYLADLFPAYRSSNQTSRKDHNDGDEINISYGGIYPRQGVSLAYNLFPIRRELGKITVPLFACHCTSDGTVPFGNLKIIAKETNSSCKKNRKIGDRDGI